MRCKVFSAILHLVDTPTFINAGCLFIHLISNLTAVVYSLDSSIHRINHYPIGQMPSKLTELSTFSYPIRTLFSEKYNPEEWEAGETHEILLAFDWELQEIWQNTRTREWVCLTRSRISLEPDLIGQKPMFHWTIKNRKSAFSCFLPHYLYIIK